MKCKGVRSVLIGIAHLFAVALCLAAFRVFALTPSTEELAAVREWSAKAFSGKPEDRGMKSQVSLKDRIKYIGKECERHVNRHNRQLLPTR